MKTYPLSPRTILTAVLFSTIAHFTNGQLTQEPVPGENLDAVFERERNLVDQVRESLRHADASSIEHLLAQQPDESLKLAASVAYAKRAAEVCAWLCNDNEYGKARVLASHAVVNLGKMDEATDGDRLERLYWEAWMEGEVLDRKERAIDLLNQAEKLAPEDDRIVELKLRLVAAIAEFGR